MAKGSQGSRGRRGRRDSKWQREPRPLDENLFSAGGISVGIVSRRDGDYHVRRISAAAAVKEYICPGCHHSIALGTPHVVAWRADSIMGDAHAASERRHWHPRCWGAG